MISERIGELSLRSSRQLSHELVEGESQAAAEMSLCEPGRQISCYSKSLRPTTLTFIGEAAAVCG